MKRSPARNADRAQINVERQSVDTTKFTIPIEPEGKKEARRTRGGHVFKHPDTRKRMDEIAESICSQYQGELLRGPLQVLIVAYRSRPKSKPKAVYVDVKPDWDNISKLVCDAATQSGVLWDDDCQIVDGRSIKLYAPPGEPGWIELFVRRHPAATLSKQAAAVSTEALWDTMYVA
ncbi:MAG TPA: RusA family crossover junction endodeoxyribonuclease [Oligoflexus sp.]|uniref:RusA family crossover junction endodeoxyribonuclease n=1 Tax=Oligoflexus sp. TaxID=1971216 RepID=UPI002D541F37|nr:RusA family crossover junction endodeoxyribonuclease [Oligoflexus sp.]HYX36846.1 RusA family crossover junction endodeoxyribonuclease [Oligoflexus sp.]